MKQTTCVSSATITVLGTMSTVNNVVSSDECYSLRLFCFVLFSCKLQFRLGLNRLWYHEHGGVSVSHYLLFLEGGDLPAQT